MSFCKSGNCGQTTNLVKTGPGEEADNQESFQLLR